MNAAETGLAHLRAGLDSALEASLAPLRGTDEPLGVLFSGGVDSSLLAWELRTRRGLSLCTVGQEKSPDVLAGRRAAESLGLPWNGMIVGPAEVHDAEERFAPDLEGALPVVRSVLVSLALAFELASPARLVCGQGVDELFLGYSHYQTLDEDGAARRSDSDLRRLRDDDWPRTVRIARRAGKEVVAPFLAEAFESAARRVPIALRLPGNAPKQFFREWAMARGLPAALALRPKKAIQYGSGIDALRRRRGSGPT